MTTANANANTKRPLVIYHKGCRDGFCAAWVVWQFYPDAEFYAAAHNAPTSDVTPGHPGVAMPEGLPDVTGREVIIVDFSYPLDVMVRIADVSSSLVVLDHHKTAEAALASFHHDKAYVVFDMNRSGAGLAWDWFFPHKVRPWLVDYVEDRDLWRFALDASHAINAFVGTIPYEFEAWSKAERMRLYRAVQLGQAVEAKVLQYVNEVSGLTRIVTFEGYEVPCVNAPHVDISELLNHLAERPLGTDPTNLPAAFSMGWSQHADGKFVYSLRSVGDFDVSEIAKKYGGGGHKNAAGFKADRILV